MKLKLAVASESYLGVGFLEVKVTAPRRPGADLFPELVF